MIPVKEVKLAARGRWPQILSAAGLPEDCLTGKNCPCPKCGGDDRFAVFSDFAETGGLICRKCHYEKNGDGIATLQWWCDWTFPEAVSFTARQVGLDRAEPKTNGKPGPRGYSTASDAVKALERKHGSRSGSWTYTDGQGNPVGLIVRWDTPVGKKILPVSLCGDKWLNRGMPGPMPLYCLPELADADRVYICEGEKAADVAGGIGLTATTSAHGAQSPHKTDWLPLAGKECVILPDHDEDGDKYADKVSSILADLKPPAVVMVVDLPDLPDHGDIADWVEAQPAPDADELRQQVEAMADQAEAIQFEAACGSPEVDAQESQEVHKSVATQLVDLAGDVNLFHCPDGNAYATFPVDDHEETARVVSRIFLMWLSRQFYGAYERVPSLQALRDAIGVLEGRAIFQNDKHDKHDVHIRVAEHGESIIVDLCNDAWQVVEIDKKGWRVLDESPVKFRRTKAMQALPTPEEGGHLIELRELLNIGNGEWPLVAAYLVAAVRPGMPFPILCLHGEQGSAKSTTARVLRSLIDPNSAPIRAEPRSQRDLAIAADNGWVIVLDNLSKVQTWLSDGLCRLSTGAGFATRKMYEDDEETIFNAMRPIILTGITEVATRGDLIDRSLLVHLPAIPEDRRLTEAEFREKFEEARPRLFGALLNAVSTAIRQLPGIQPDGLPRMADFSMWAMAAESDFGSDTPFLEAYKWNRDSADDLAIEVSLVAQHFMTFMANLDVDVWEGTATELLGELNDIASDQDRQMRSWPKGAQTLGGDLVRLAPNLRKVGVHMEKVRESSRRLIRLTRTKGESCVTDVIDVMEAGPVVPKNDIHDAKKTGYSDGRGDTFQDL